MTSTDKYIEQASNIFNSIEKWNAFVELTKIKSKIIEKWNSELEDAIKERLNNIKDISNKWEFIKYTNTSYGWYLKEFGIGSITVLFEDNQFCLWVDWNKYNPNEIVKKYQNTKLLSSYFRDEELKENNAYFAVRKNACNINNISDLEILAYFAKKNSTEHIILLENISSFFIYFMDDIDVIDTIKKINIEFKRNTSP